MGKTTAAREHAVTDGGDTVGNGNTGKTTAAIERSVSDASDAPRNDDIGQSNTARKRFFTNAINIVGNRIFSGLSCRICQNTSRHFIE